jgi:hypothetical protein
MLIIALHWLDEMKRELTGDLVSTPVLLMITPPADVRLSDRGYCVLLLKRLTDDVVWRWKVDAAADDEFQGDNETLGLRTC